MTRGQIKAKLSKYFKTTELVCPHVYERFGESAWNYFDIRLLEVLLWLRVALGLPITINDWRAGKTQRGLRCNLCQIVKEKIRAYLSSHIFGKGIDFDVKGMNAHDVRQWINDHKSELPHNIRLEVLCNGKEITWVHLDVCNETSEKIVYFND